MEDAKQKRQQILSKFVCPFTCESTQPDNDCPFGHLSQSELLSMIVDLNYKCPLNLLPAYCCASYLALKCSKREYSFQCGAHSSAEVLTRCEDGFHMELSEVDDLQLFAQKMAKVLLGASVLGPTNSKFGGLVPVHNPTAVLREPLQSNCISAGNKRPRDEQIKNDDDKEDDDDDHSCSMQCAICYDQLCNNQTPFGLLDSCSHVFCATCIHKWRNTSPHEDCPVCRKRITKIIVWPKLLQTQEEKQKLFDLISGDVPTDERVDLAIATGSFTSFTTSEGKTMKAYQMNPQNMKVFLKKPKPNWNCYVMTGSAVERSGNLTNAPLRVYSLAGPTPVRMNITENNANNNATNNAAPNPTTPNNVASNAIINSPNIQSQTGWFSMGPNNNLIPSNQNMPMYFVYDRNSSTLNLSANNSRLNNVVARFIPNPNNVSSANSNTNNVAEIANSNTNNVAEIGNSNANNASTNSSTFDRMIDNAEYDSDDDDDDDEDLLIIEPSN